MDIISLPKAASERAHQTGTEDVQKQLTFRRSPRLEIEYEGDGGGHFVRAIAADGKSSLGSAPTMVLMDERGHWAADEDETATAAGALLAVVLQ